MNLNDIKKITVPACKRFNVKRLDIFGSIVRGEESETSDMDFLVEFNDPENRPSKRYFGLLHHFEDEFRCSIDLVTIDGLKNPYFRNRIMKERINIYGG